MSATIIQFEAENIKCLKAVRIDPQTGTVIITGKNDQGKSSALDAIDYAFRGGREICDEPIRQGEKRARTFVKLSEELDGVCTIERKFTPSGTVLEIRNLDGVPQKNPQALLDAICSKISFDPLSFVRKRKDEQLQILMQLAGLNFTELNAVRKNTFDERTIRNRELESAKTKLRGLTFNAALPKEPVSVMVLAKKLGEIASFNSSNHARRTAVQLAEKKASDLCADVAQLDYEIAEMLRQVDLKRAQRKVKSEGLDIADSEASTQRKAIYELKDISETEVRKQIEDIQITNQGIQANTQYKEVQDNVDLLTGAVTGLTAKIKECDDDKSAQIEFAQFPLAGLSFDEERGVLLNNVPFAQGSQAKQLQAAIAIGLALNPRVKVILIRDGSLMDEISLKAVAEMADKNKAQVWIEIVNSKDPQAIVIEDGEVK